MLFQEPFIQSYSDSSPAALVCIKHHIFGWGWTLNPIQGFWAIPAALHHIYHKSCIYRKQTALVSSFNIPLLSNTTTMQVVITNKTAFLVLFIYVGLLAVHVERASAIRSINLGFRSSSSDEDFLQMVNKSWHRSLLKQEVNQVMTDLKNTNSKQQHQEPANKTFDPNRASKRRVRKGSDPIHNKSWQSDMKGMQLFISDDETKQQELWYSRERNCSLQSSPVKR